MNVQTILTVTDRTENAGVYTVYPPSEEFYDHLQ